jgi:hypothetical protein
MGKRAADLLVGTHCRCFIAISIEGSVTRPRTARMAPSDVQMVHRVEVELRLRPLRPRRHRAQGCGNPTTSRHRQRLNGNADRLM